MQDVNLFSEETQFSSRDEIHGSAQLNYHVVDIHWEKNNEAQGHRRDFTDATRTA